MSGQDRPVNHDFYIQDVQNILQISLTKISLSFLILIYIKSLNTATFPVILNEDTNYFQFI